MKIYINKYNPKNVNMKILNELDKYLIDSKKYVEIISLEGMYQINENSIQKINIQSDNLCVVNNYLEKYDLYLDDSKYVMDTVYQIPSSHELTTIFTFTYRQNEKSKIKMIVEGIYNSKNIDKYTNFITTNFYFQLESKDNIEDLMIKEEINVFLLLLN